jgi:hypothetical protein
MEKKVQTIDNELQEKHTTKINWEKLKESGILYNLERRETTVPE